MSDQAVTFDIPYLEERNRGSVAIRLILAIPHMILMGLWSYLIMIVTFAQWFIVIFTGKRNDGIWRMQNNWMGYATRVMTYLGLMHDEFPPFGTDAGAVPVTYDFGYSAEASRLTNGLRMIWAIPASIVTFFYVLVAEFIAIAIWFAIVITGSMPRSLYDFSMKAHRQAIRTQTYGNLMTDVYPNANA